MKKLIVGGILSGCLAGFSLTANAEGIGRTVVDIDSTQWSLLTSFEGAFKYDKYLRQPLYTKVFQMKNKQDEIIALLSITSTDAGFAGKVQWISEVCPDARTTYFTNDFGSNKQSDTRQCLVVNSAFAPFKFYAADSEVIKALNEKNAKLFTSGYSLRTKYGSPTGTYLSVNLMTTKKFMGLFDTSAKTNDLHDVPEELIAWGESLHQNVKRSATSLGGKLQLPEIEFVD